jgi:hypothetical protein
MRPNNKNKGARATVIARQQLCKYATIPDPSIRTVHTQHWRNCWKRCFLCGQRREYVKTVQPNWSCES